MKKIRRTVLMAVISVAMVFTFIPFATVDAASVQAPGKVKATTVTKSYTSVKVSWTKAKKAKGYSLYRSKSRSGKYKKIKQTSKRVYTDAGLKANTVYYYKVRAYRNVNGKKLYGKYSSSKKGIAGAEKVTGFSVITGGTYEYLIQKWNQKDQFRGYELYRADSQSGPFTRITYFDNSKDDEVIWNEDGDVSGNTTYWYKVRGYRTVNGKTYYGNYSTVKSGTAKNGVGEAKASVTPGTADNEGKITEFTVKFDASKYNYAMAMVPSNKISRRSINNEIDNGPVNALYLNKLWGKCSHMVIESYSLNGGTEQTYSNMLPLVQGSTVTLKMKAKTPLTEKDSPFEYSNDGILLIPCIYNGNVTYMLLKLDGGNGTGYALDYTQYIKALSGIMDDISF